MTLPIGAVQGLVNAVGGSGLSSSAAGINAGGSPSALGLAEPAGSAGVSLTAEPTAGVGAVGSPTAVGAGEAAGGAGGQESGGFGEALTNAISSLEGTQKSASAAAQALATGSTGNPESAVVTVADAQLAMQLASQLRTKGTEALQQIFQTQV
ncbi:MAG TPA: flagellar hook-basal body complex protein FliE [Solirubrobacteraceae bacterium]